MKSLPRSMRWNEAAHFLGALFPDLIVHPKTIPLTAGVHGLRLRAPARVNGDVRCGEWALGSDTAASSRLAPQSSPATARRPAMPPLSAYVRVTPSQRRAAADPNLQFALHSTYGSSSPWTILFYRKEGGGGGRHRGKPLPWENVLEHLNSISVT